MTYASVISKLKLKRTNVTNLKFVSIFYYFKYKLVIQFQTKYV